ncbi:helix-turn-helix domain-containing protein [Salipiger marinus]|uniref:Regulatory protein, Fis family n=1 Tax=Salipiger marinus TaxID=555512 RepID=A0A1G8MPG5_9RHOB|nr:helix-turn-helix domain-containing protein [Salipiger marinus]SDI69919.1 regulatory protein, Fis family [Salipiger marinus]
MRTLDIFGSNLREMIDRKHGGNVSAAARELPVNRTQLNRYLERQSWPRPDVLERICTHFGVDGRVLLQPLKDFEKEGA